MNVLERGNLDSSYSSSASLVVLSICCGCTALDLKISLPAASLLPQAHLFLSFDRTGKDCRHGHAVRRRETVRRPEGVIRRTRLGSGSSL